MKNAKRQLVEKLYDLCRIEQESLLLIGAEARTAAQPALAARLRDHAVETRWQLRVLEVCLENLGYIRQIRPRPARAVRLADFKQHEIRAYRAAIAAAEAAGDPETAGICRELLEQERAMAGWLDDEAAMPGLTGYRLPGSQALHPL